VRLSLLPSMRVGLVLALLFVGGTAGATPFPAVWLPLEGDGYLIPPTWAERGLRYGTAELIGLIERAAREVADEEPGAILYVADLSLRTGGWTTWHKSHRNGCDADLLFFATDDVGDPRPLPTRMVPFDDDGIAWTVDDDGDRIRLHFDTARNWALVRALITDEDTRVARIFIADPLRARLLRYAVSTDEAPEVIARAAEVLVQPGDSEAHDDHMHIRIAAPPGVVSIEQETYARAAVKKWQHGRRAKPHTLVRHKKKVAKRTGKRA